MKLSTNDIMKIMETSDRATAIKIMKQAGAKIEGVGSMKRRGWIVPFRLFRGYLSEDRESRVSDVNKEYRRRLDRLDVEYRRMEGIEEVTK